MSFLYIRTENGQPTFWFEDDHRRTESYFVAATKVTETPTEFQRVSETPILDAAAGTITYRAIDLTVDELKEKLSKSVNRKHREKIDAGFSTIPDATSADSALNTAKSFDLSAAALQKARDLLGLIAAGTTIEQSHRFLFATCGTKCELDATKIKALAKKILNHAFKLDSTRDQHLAAIKSKTSVSDLRSYAARIDSGWP